MFHRLWAFSVVLLKAFIGAGLSHDIIHPLDFSCKDTTIFLYVQDCFNKNPKKNG